MRIREVVRETGVSRELIHHYLRNGLLPGPERRAHYSQRHVLLLRLLKKLREDHHLPLEVIRTVFEIYDFDPAHLEPFTLADSLNNRLTHLTNGGDLLSATYPAGEIVRQADVSPDRLRDYVQAKLVRPLVRDGEETYSLYDMNIIALCDRGARLGIPLDSLRNISAYVRVAFELEHKVLFEAAGQKKREGKKALGEIFVRQEIVTSLIQNLLQSLIRHRLTDLIELDRETASTLDDVLFRPSLVFCKRHGLDLAVEAAQESLCASPEDPGHWAFTARLMLHAGRHREAVFFLEQALLQWPSDPSLISLHGRALLLSGAHDRGLERLCRPASPQAPDPLGRAFVALCLLHRTGAAAAEQALGSRARDLPRWVDETLEAAEEAAWEVRTEVRMISGWVLYSLPGPLQRSAEGVKLLTETYATLNQCGNGAPRIPGLRERYLINAAYLLFRCRQGPAPLRGGRAPAGAGAPSAEDLRTLICSLDPASAFAERVFLERADPATDSEEDS